MIEWTKFDDEQLVKLEYRLSMAHTISYPMPTQDYVAAMQLRETLLHRKRRAGLSPIARTEIERVVEEMRENLRNNRRSNAVILATMWSTKTRQWLAALDSVLGAASTKEPK